MGRVRLGLLFLVILLLLTPSISYGQSSSYYSVTINESGLQTGTEWSITVNGAQLFSNNSTLVFLATDGTYNIVVNRASGLSPSPSTIPIIVDGRNLSYGVTFGQTKYSVEFTESGLPYGTVWSVKFGNDTGNSSNTTIIFQARNGTYDYIVPSVNGVNSSIPNSTLTVNGWNVDVSLRFLVIIQFIFIVTGLTSGSHWSVLINGTHYNSSSTSVSIMLENGTYQYKITLPSGYSADPREGNINWNNTLVLVNASTPLGYEIGGSVLAIIVALVLVFYVVRTKRSKLKPE